MADDKPRKRKRHPRGTPMHYTLLPPEEHPGVRERRREERRHVLMWVLVCLALLALMGLILSYFAGPP